MKRERSLDEVVERLHKKVKRAKEKWQAQEDDSTLKEKYKTLKKKYKTLKKQQEQPQQEQQQDEEEEVYDEHEQQGNEEQPENGSNDDGTNNNTTNNNNNESSVFVGNLPYHIDEDTLYEVFKDCGENGYDSIKAIRFGEDENGNFKRYCHIDFDSVQAAGRALELSGQEVMGKPLNIQAAAGKQGTFKMPEKPADNPDYVDRCYMGNLSYDVTEEILVDEFEKLNIRAKYVTFTLDRETGNFYGTGFVTFDTWEDAAWAVAVGEAGWTILGRKPRIEYCPHRNKKKQDGGDAGDGKGGFKRSDTVKPPSTRPDGGTVTAFFGNLAYDIEDDHLIKFCKPYGDIKTIRWLENKQTGEFRGAGFADFTSMEAVDNCVKNLNGKKLLGRIVRVDYAPNTKKKKQ